MMIDFYDTFTESGALLTHTPDSAPLGAWAASTGSPAWTVDGTRCASPSFTGGTGSGSTHLAHYDMQAGDGTLSVALTYTGTPTAATNAGLLFRYVDDLNWWRWIFARNGSGSFSLYLQKRVAGTYSTVITAAGSGFVPGHSLSVELNGSSIKAFHNSTQIGATVTDTAHQTATKHGLIVAAGSGVAMFPYRFDNLARVDLAAPTPAATASGSLRPYDRVTVAKATGGQVDVSLAELANAIAEQHDAEIPTGFIYEPFMDRVRVADWDGVTQITTEAAKDAANPLFPPVGPNAGTWDYSKGYCSVTRVGSQWVMHYRSFEKSGSILSRLCYATSIDGVTWTKPNLGIYNFGGSTANNIICEGDFTSVSYDPASGLWIGLTEQDKLPPASGIEVGINTSPSPTGPFRLIKRLTAPLYPDSLVGSEPRGIMRRDDGRWLLTYSCGHYLDVRRQEAWLSDTSDLAGTWTNQATVIPCPSPQEQVYGLTATRISDVHIGFVMRYDTTAKTIWADLWTSRSGLEWQQVAANWIPNGPAGAWDDGLIIQGTGIVTDGDDWHVYYAASPDIHGSGYGKDVRIGRVTVPRDRLAGYTGTGHVSTTTLRPTSAASLSVNCDAAGGSVTIDVIDAATRQPIPGFAATDMTAITADAFDVVPTWAGGPMPTDRDIRLRFHLDNATLHSYRITPASQGDAA